jgi:multidrug efflux pump subunit AcrA (membrane-fusion protein)
VVSGPSLLKPGTTVSLTVAHVLDEGRVAFGGLAVPYTRTGTGTVEVAVPAGVAAFAGQQIAVSLTSGTVSGRPLRMRVAP